MGVLDLYSTHLFVGDDLLGEEPSAEEKLGIQLIQIEEIVQFIRDTHLSENVALLMGDFNINAMNTAGYQTLTNTLAGVQLFDVWPFQFPEEPEITVGKGITDIGFTNDQDVAGR